MGSLFGQVFAPVGEVVAVDARPAGPRSVRGDVTRPAPDVRAEISAADVVLLALPEATCEAAVAAVAREMKPGALLADTCSVKETVTTLLADAADRHSLQACSVNPMFAPGLDPSGRPVAFVTVRSGSRVRLVEDLLVRAGMRLVPVTAVEHDRLTAVMQAATHASVLAFGRVLVHEDCDVEKLVRLAPPPHLTMLSLLARVVSGSPEVYWDIQAGNARADWARQALRDGLDHLSTVVVSGDRRGFADALAEINHKLGPRGPDLAARCARLFGRPESRVDPDEDDGRRNAG
ncbi:prephenate dehydrogenase/arogenate dehydrogenase family protein [Actinosynnema sp. ALI-1.44]|uniref:prephenate dehydrogenase/arogenate dehydrogenase family protein n=1 Tax=Actinosynnema sp. ALI-1.44 TaxID=1933779 RepID=UPI00143D250F|nr:prephenate dehydrogenase/arogenate dehydrogenase family protein [Actinosynnema sp. ALI-1.44]